MEIDKVRKKELSDFAEFISIDYCASIPVLPEIIAEQGSISYSYGNYGNCFDGLLEYDGNFHIYLNVRNNLTPDNPRIRFSFAHELGHYFIDEHRNALVTGKSLHKSYNQYLRRNIVELEADLFASNLLMPKQSFLDDITNKKFSIDIINSLKNKYKVSFTACAIQFLNIGNHPIMIVYAENNQIKWKFFSEDFRYKRLKNDNIVPKDTVIGEYFNHNNIENTRKTEIVWAIDWFYYVKDEDIRKQFYEYCLPNQNSALSVIWED
ncbi:MAG: ImmA/IrrE family metallo-endopeptidase [Dysgonamonadaceae bacterium]|nr:ImmA/IrrE family metallo-endopeptidase [Dysgonamonadaceae bacterium]